MIIGFTGKIGAGKDTAGAYLVEKYGFERISFAAKLKQSAAACFGIDVDSWERLKNSDHARIKMTWEDTVYVDISARQFLQNYGTEAHRDIFGQDFWVQQALKDAGGTIFGDNFVVTDVRFDNEAIGIQRRGGLVIQINRSDDVAVVHSSEAGISDNLIDGKVANIGTIEQLHILLDALMERVLPDTNGERMDYEKG